MPRLLAISGFDTKGPACFLLDIEGRRLMLDLGAGPDAGRLPDLADAGRIDALILSHGHADHTGALHLRRQIGMPPVHATSPVIALSSEAIPGLASPIPLGTSTIAGITVETGTAGHAPGAVWMRIGGEKGLVYTGDYSAESTLWSCEAPLPASAALVDASYGDKGEGQEQQCAALLEVARAGPLLLPAPAAGRGLEMACVFMNAGHHVSLCPSHFRVARQMTSHPDWLAPEALEQLQRLIGTAHLLDAESLPRGVMFAAKASADDGVAQNLARRFAETHSAQVTFTGHLAAGTPAEALVRSSKADFKRWNVHPSLGGMRSLLEAIAPRITMPAFTGPTGRRALAAALPGTRFSDGPEMIW